MSSSSVTRKVKFNPFPSKSMSKLEIEAYPYEHKVGRTMDLISQRVTKKNQEIIKKYDRQMVNESLAIATRVKHLEVVMNLSVLVNKDWNEVNSDDIDNLVYAIITKYSDNGQETHTTYDHKKILKIFFRWFKLGSRSKNDVGDPEETKRIKTKNVKNKIVREQLLTDDDLVALVKNARNLRDKAMIAVAYESGVRPGELLSLRLKHVKVDEYGAILSVDGKMGARNVRIVKSVPTLMTWIDNHPFKEEPQYPLWVVQNHGSRYGYPLDSATWKKQLGDISRRAGLKKRVYPNLFRHTSATNSANYLTESQLRKRQGWTPDSKMPSVYVHLVNADVDEAYLKHMGIKLEKKKETTMLPKMCPVCKSANSFESDICHQCGKALDLESAITLEENNTLTEFQNSEITRLQNSNRVILNLVENLTRKVLEFSPELDKKSIDIAVKEQMEFLKTVPTENGGLR